MHSGYSASRQLGEGPCGQTCELFFEKTGETQTRSCLGEKQDPRRTQNCQPAQKLGSRLTLHFPPLPIPPPLRSSPPPRPFELSLHLEGTGVLPRQVTAPHQLTNQCSWNDSAKSLATDNVQGRLLPKLVRATVSFRGCSCGCRWTGCTITKYLPSIWWGVAQAWRRRSRRSLLGWHS